MVFIPECNAFRDFLTKNPAVAGLVVPRMEAKNCFEFLEVSEFEKYEILGCRL